MNPRGPGHAASRHTPSPSHSSTTPLVSSLMADARSQPPRAPESPMTATARAEPRGCAGSTQYKGFKQVHREQQEKRRNRKTPPPWITRKLAVFIIYGLIIFATYVYIGRLCVPLIRRDPGAVGGGRGVGGEWKTCRLGGRVTLTR